MATSLSRLLLVAGTMGLVACWEVGCPAPAYGQDTAVKEGQPAPDVELPATQIGKVLPEKQNDKVLRLKDLQGKKNVVLYFFPKAKTKG